MVLGIDLVDDLVAGFGLSGVKGIVGVGNALVPTATTFDILEP